MKLCTEFQMAYLHLTLTHSKGHGRAYFDSEYLEIVKGRANNTTTIKYEVMYDLSINMFTFELHPSGLCTFQQ